MKILGNEIIYRDEDKYVSFPNMARLADGTIICAFRHAQDRQKEYGLVTHVDPTAKDVFVMSKDGGKTFEKELHVILDDEMSDQDPCFNVLRNGRIVCSHFRWGLVPLGEGPKLWGPRNFRRYGRHLFDKFDCFHIAANVSISDDNGKTWKHGPIIQDNKKNIPLCTGVRGNIVELDDGTLLMPFYGCLRLNQLNRCGLVKSTDGGETWKFLSVMAYDPAKQKHFIEPNLFRTKSGRLIGLYRTQKDWMIPGIDFEKTYLNLHMSVSDDNGKTFSEPVEIENCFASSPFHALQLKSGKVLLVYGYRKEPYGIRARLCNSELTDISESKEIILVDNAPLGDLGYPHAIQLDNGEILVSYYIADEEGVRFIQATRLVEDEDDE